MAHYAITIGPIVDTLLQARKTRELWGASYLFSYLMKCIVKEVKSQAGTKVLMPYPKDEIKLNDDRKTHIYHDKYGAGIFPDRCVFESDKSLAEVDRLVTEVKDRVIKEIAHHCKAHDRDFDSAMGTAYFKSYLKVYLVSKQPEASTKAGIISEMFKALDAVELQPQLPPPESENYLTHFLTRSSFRPSFLVDAGYSIERKQRLRFESTIEISCSQLGYDFKEVDFGSSVKKTYEVEDKLIDQLKSNYTGQFRTYHKYFAIVHIDGDNFGSIIKSLGNDESYDDFSETLTRFSLLVNERIKVYNGLPVYVGGDDAVFFAPIRTTKGTIFDLLDRIDDLFYKQFKDFISINTDEGNRPSLSAGISVVYYKHPLYEAIEESRTQLFGIAKNYPAASGIKKNAIAVSIQKHSGQRFSSVLFKNKELQSYSIFKEMLKLNIENGALLSSTIQFVTKNVIILEEIGEDADRVKHFLDNQFNESVHEHNKFLKILSGLIPAVYSEYETGLDKNGYSKRNEALHGMLRMVKFLNREDNE